MPFSFSLGRNGEEGISYTKKSSTFLLFSEADRGRMFSKGINFCKNRILKYLTIGNAKAPYITVLIPTLSLTEQQKQMKICSLNTGSKQTNRDLS